MIKKALVSVTLLSVMLVFTSCRTDSEYSFHRLIEKLNSEYGYSFKESDFITEKKENIIYQKMTDNKTMLSLYCNKNSEIIQCTLSSFDINNSDNLKTISTIGSILTNEKKEYIESKLKNPDNNFNFCKNNWNIKVVKNQIGITYIISKEGSQSNNQPSLKNIID